MNYHFYNYTIDALKDLLVSEGFKSFNGDQIYKWVYEQNIVDPDQMTNISKPLKNYLKNRFDFSYLDIANKQVSSDGTQKFLFRLHDGHVIETVLMKYKHGNSVCVTSQVGCSMGCSFCASGIISKKRDLSLSELVNQVASVQHYTGEKVSNIVVMGTGEPFDNYDNVMDFIRVINYKQGFQIGSRHITVSTCGLIPKIYDYANEEIKSNLAISLHAPNNDLRTHLMKINKVYPLPELIKAVRDYTEISGRRVTFEYILLRGVNDEVKHANELSDLIRGINCYVNLIPYNPVDEFGYEKTDPERAQRFYQQLEKRGINATLRRELGSDIDAACGQLRLKGIKNNRNKID